MSGCVRQARIVCDYHTKVRAKSQRRRQMQGVERPQLAWIEVTRSVQQRLLKADQSHGVEEPPRGPYVGILPGSAEGPDGLGPEQCGRGALRPASQNPLQSRGFGLCHNQLHER